jgi:hypothetical protein
MASAAQTLANQENAKLSTGPRTEAGKQKSSSNAYRHGLHATSEKLFASSPEERDHYEQIKANLKSETLPRGTAEELAFEQYAYSSFQALRAQRIEAEAQDRWLEDPDNHLRFAQMERTIKLGALFERRAAKALKQLQDLQLHRLASVEVIAELEDSQVEAQIPTSMPMAKIRLGQLRREDPGYVGLNIAYGSRNEINRTNLNDPSCIEPIGDNREREPEIK